MNNDLLTFRRFEGLLAEAVKAFEDKKSVTWDVKAVGYSPQYIRKVMRSVVKIALENESWVSIIDRPTLREATRLYEWGVTESSLIFRPKYSSQKTRTLITVEGIPVSNDPATLCGGMIRSPIKIDGTSREYVERICYLKNHNQITEDVLLLNLPSELQNEMTQLFPNIELIQDEQLGELTPHYILI